MQAALFIICHPCKLTHYAQSDRSLSKRPIPLMSDITHIHSLNEHETHGYIMH